VCSAPITTKIVTVNIPQCYAQCGRQHAVELEVDPEGSDTFGFMTFGGPDSVVKEESETRRILISCPLKNVEYAVRITFPYRVKMIKVRRVWNSEG